MEIQFWSRDENFEKCYILKHFIITYINFLNWDVVELENECSYGVYACVGNSAVLTHDFWKILYYF